MFKKPTLLLILALIICYAFTDSFSSDFEIITLTCIKLLLTFCLFFAISNQINSSLSRYNKPIMWFIGVTSTISILFSFFLWYPYIPDIGWVYNIIVVPWLTILGSLLIFLITPFFSFLYSLIKKLKWKIAKRFVVYIDRLLSPIYLFPLKLVTYSTYYFIILVIKTLVELLKIFIDVVKFPFASFRNFLKSLLIFGLSIYIIASVFVIFDYLRTHYGYYGKFLCSIGTTQKLKKSVVRIVGGYSEGTGFFVADNQVLTNFHVIDGEPSPKIIFPDGSFITPTKITGNKDADLALLFTEKNYSNMVMTLPDFINFKDEEPLIATGFAMGTDLVGDATAVRGNYIDYRSSRNSPVSYIQTNISLVDGMSGGPLTDQCGTVAGVNTLGLAGLSLFISGSQAKQLIPDFTDQEIEKIKVDPSKSPEDAVKAFYIYLKARRMEDGFKLLSQTYLQKTNYQEWTNRFLDIIDVDVVNTKIFEKTDDTVFIKFMTKSWVIGEVEIHRYEGTWQTILEDGVYKMLKSNIKEVMNPKGMWFYE